jgi:hypothetical protein
MNRPFQSELFFGAGVFLAAGAWSAAAGTGQPTQTSDSATAVAEKMLRLFTEPPASVADGPAL